jgi:hypothetical protein
MAVPPGRESTAGGPERESHCIRQPEESGVLKAHGGHGWRFGGRFYSFQDVACGTILEKGWSRQSCREVVPGVDAFVRDQVPWKVQK